MKRLAIVASVLAPLACAPAPEPAAPAPPPSSSTAAARPSAAQPPPKPSASASAAPARRPDAPDAKPPKDLGREACKRGDIEACDVLADYWSAREIMPKGRDKEAHADAEILKQACESNHISSACMGYALMLKYGSATGKRDNDAGKPYWAKVRELKDLNGYRGEPTNDEGREALLRVEAECEKGRVRSCAQAGWAAYNGVQRDKSIRDSYVAYERACRLGNAASCRWAGHYAHVYDEVRDFALSERLLRRSCDGDNPGGCDELGGFVEKEKRKRDEARKLFERGCEGGSRTACTHLGDMLVGGSKAEKEQAISLYQAACDADDESGCGQLAPLYEHGDGVKKDIAAAQRAYARACQGNVEGGCEGLGRVAGTDLTDKCVLTRKPPPKIDDRALEVLRSTCKKKRGAAYCRGISSCP